MTEEQIKIESIIKELSDMPESWYYKENMDLFIASYRTLQQQNKQLKETLSWYADHTNYHPYRFMSEDGKRARAVLLQIQGKDEER